MEIKSYKSGPTERKSVFSVAHVGAFEWVMGQSVPGLTTWAIDYRSFGAGEKSGLAIAREGG